MAELADAPGLGPGPERDGGSSPLARTAVDVEVAVPVYNESGQVADHIRRLRAHLDQDQPFTTVVTIVDNASTDGTWAIVDRLARDMPGVCAIHLDRKGRGGAIRAVWKASSATVVAYMDVDLSTDLDAFAPLVLPLLAGCGDVSVGSRRLPGSQVRRGVKREVISRTYIALVRTLLHCCVSDAQCGFKAMRGALAGELLAEVADNEWFFDTELLVRAQQRGLRIREVPVTWVDDPDSRVRLIQTAIKDLRGIARLRRSTRAAP